MAGTAEDLIVATGAGLMRMPQYLAGSLNLNVQGIYDFLLGVTSATATLQIQQGTTGAVNTVLQTTLTLKNTLIVGTPTVPFPPLASINGLTVIPSGSNVVTVSFPVTLIGAPTLVIAQPRMPTGLSSTLQGNVDESSITASGFNFILGSVPGDSLHKLQWFTIP